MPMPALPEAPRPQFRPQTHRSMFATSCCPRQTFPAKFFSQVFQPSFSDEISGGDPKPARNLPKHQNLRAHADTVVQIHDILIVHADSSVGHEPTDRIRCVGTMNSVLPLAQGHRRGTHRVSRTASW